MSELLNSLETAVTETQKVIEHLMNSMSNSVRYDFSWQVHNEQKVCAIVTRNEWLPGVFVMSPPTKKTEVLIEVDEHTIRISPVPPAKSFQPFPEEEENFLSAILRAYFAGVRHQQETHHWESVCKI